MLGNISKRGHCHLRSSFTAGALDRPVRPLDCSNPSIDLQMPPQGLITHGGARPVSGRTIDRCVVRCAEDLVFSSKADRKIGELVKKYGTRRVDSNYAGFPAPNEDAVYLRRHGRSTSVSGPDGPCSEAPGSLHESSPG